MVWHAAKLNGREVLLKRSATARPVVGSDSNLQRYSSSASFSDFCAEASLLSDVNHPNLLQLVGESS